jgi:hypothetical protein
MRQRDDAKIVAKLHGENQAIVQAEVVTNSDYCPY